MKSMIIVNFGGPRSLNEVESFLIALLTDKDVIRTKLPNPIHNWFFTRIAKKRALKIQADYELIGGKSPIFEDTEAVAELASAVMSCNILTFHRYLPATHSTFLEKASDLSDALVFPMFPQFSFATTGSIARFFAEHLPENRFQWIKSYADHPAFVTLIRRNIRAYLSAHNLREEDTILLFSAHGIPRKFVETGDIYEEECKRSFAAISKAFPRALSRLSYQSKFGRGEWLTPSTEDVCNHILTWHEGRKNVLIIPLSFTSDHIETLFEIDYQYLPPIIRANLAAHRLPAPNRTPAWISTIATIAATSPLTPTQNLIF